MGTYLTRLYHRIWWHILHWSPINKHTSSCGNRFTKVGMLGPIEVTMVFMDTRKEVGYSREELYRMLILIREQEEVQKWKVPEPAPCIHCHHVSPTDDNGFCPICGCPRHTNGLAQAFREALDKDLFTINPSAASTGSLQDG